MFGFLLVAELLCRLLPVGTASEGGYYFDPDILVYPPHREWQVATGWDLRNPQPLRSNNQGFVAAHDFVPDPSALALIGDSYVEASMLPSADRPAARLEQTLGGRRPVYAMGSPGTALLDYAERVRFASRQFGIRDFVIFMEQGDVEQALCGSGNVQSACLDPATLTRRTERIPAASVAKRVLRQSALAQYVFSQLKVEPRRLASAALVLPGAAPVTASALTSPEAQRKADARAEQVAEAVAREFLQVVRSEVRGRLIVVADADRSRIQASLPIHAPARQRFMALAREAGWVVVDMEPRYRQHFAQSGLSLSVGPYDGHLNPLGVSLVAQAAAEAVRAGGR